MPGTPDRTGCRHIVDGKDNELLNANSLFTNLLITLLVLLLVIVMPAIDLRVCRKLGLNLMGGVSPNQNADRLLRLRYLVLGMVFAVYLAGFAYLVFFSRSAAEQYTVHTALYHDLAGSIQVDYGLFDFIGIMFTEGIPSALSHVRILYISGITQVYMNIMLFVPMGYLLPYIFTWFRKGVRYRPVLACFVISFAMENLQLVTKRGFYDLDDLVSNTIGGFLGQMCFIAFAYVITHPDWRKERKAYRRWKKNAHKRTLYPFARKVHLSRTVLYAASEEAIWDFYVLKLGFRIVRQLVPEDSPETSFLLELGSSQVEIRCSNCVPSADGTCGAAGSALQGQNLVISVSSIARVRKRLEQNGIVPGPISQDPFTEVQCFSFDAPDGVLITILGEE